MSLYYGTLMCLKHVIWNDIYHAVKMIHNHEYIRIGRQGCISLKFFLEKEKMDRSLQPGDYVVIYPDPEGETYQLNVVQIVSPEGIYISPISDTTKRNLLIQSSGKWTLDGTPIGKIEFRAKESVPQLLFTNVPETDMQILNNLDDKILGLVCQSDKYAQSLCQKEELWKQRIDKYIDDEDDRLEYLKVRILPLDWKKLYIALKKYYNKVWVVLFIDTDSPQESSTGGVFRRKKDAIDNIVGDLSFEINAEGKEVVYVGRKEYTKDEIRRTLMDDDEVELLGIYRLEAHNLE